MKAYKALNPVTIGLFSVVVEMSGEFKGSDPFSGPGVVTSGASIKTVERNSLGRTELVARVMVAGLTQSYAVRCRLARPLERVVRRDDFSVSRPVTNLCSTLAISV